MEQAFPARTGDEDPAEVFPPAKSGDAEPRRSTTPRACVCAVRPGTLVHAEPSRSAGVRGADRRHEIAMRFARGANRRRNRSGPLTESFVRRWRHRLAYCSSSGLYRHWSLWFQHGSGPPRAAQGKGLIIFATAITFSPRWLRLAPALRSTKAASRRISTKGTRGQHGPSPPATRVVITQAPCLCCCSS